RLAREAGALLAVVRSARPRDLLPRGNARLLPHARMRPRRERLHELAGRRERRRPLLDAGEAARRRARARRRNLAPLPAYACRRPRHHRSFHSGGQMKVPLATVLVAAAALVSASVASAHAHVSPPIVVKGES